MICHECKKEVLNHAWGWKHIPNYNTIIDYHKPGHDWYPQPKAFIQQWCDQCILDDMHENERQFYLEEIKEREDRIYFKNNKCVPDTCCEHNKG